MSLILKILKATSLISFLILLILFTVADVIQANTPAFDNKAQDITNESSQRYQEKSINDLLGPEDNFPFLPDNHRDGSNPIGRIGKIKNLP